MVSFKTIQKKRKKTTNEVSEGLFELIPMDSKVAMSGAAWKTHHQWAPYHPWGWHIYLHFTIQINHSLSCR